MKQFLRVILFVICGLQFFACGNTGADKTDASTSKKESTADAGSTSDGGNIIWNLDGKKMQSIEYRCSWILDKDQNIFNFTAFWEKNVRVNFLKHLGCNIYNCKAEPATYHPSLRTLGIMDKDPNFSLSVNLHQDDFNGIYAVQKTEDGGEIIITKIDTVNHVVSGTFHGIMHGHDGKQFEITDGRFSNLHCKMVYDLDAEMKKSKEVIDNIDMQETTDKVKEMEKKSGKH